MSFRQPRIPHTIVIEKKTVSAMMKIYCARHHDGHDELCGTCATLLTYSHARLDACPYGADKPTCKACPIHCYRPAERAAMQTMMRFAGPRMLFRHPWLSIVHLWKERFRKAPRRPLRRPSA